MEPTGTVEYEPVSVKAVLSEMKDTAELLIDLSYSAVLLGSDDVAGEVLELEAKMDVLQLRARMSLLMACRSPDDAESLAPVLGMVGAAEKISDAAGDIAKVVLEDIGLPDTMRAALPEAVETLVRATVRSDSPLAGQTLGTLNLETETGVRALAIRRQGSWLLNPTRETQLQAEDVVLLRGPEDGVSDVYQDATGEPYEPPEPPEGDTQDLERAVDSIVLMKDMGELAVDLAYGAVLFDSEAVAEEVVELEAEVDALQSRFEAWTLRAAADMDDPVSLRGLVHLARSTEVISDAALEISEGVLRGLSTHPVVAEAVRESDEIIVRATVAEESELAGRTIGDTAVKTETGMRIIAIRRGAGESDRTGREGGEWVVSPGPETPLMAGDVLLAKGTRTGADRLDALTGPSERA
ncbi:potassium channel family protein [Haloarcula salinisoli]|uniref:Potassium channel protein n=1 Tax=Haloarcula salinisoli TaxID=2487746 RepID=A0A8J7YLC2_9EURY|nr:TrkA C-terminal domain-containing protein [Halomicroarcula salinisoli]MBX0286571.1 potassium channel protein [Halomicroarcula salinisoli]MBX0303921.1 potassium channel protein [Halomicroarcula salinisoli]